MEGEGLYLYSLWMSGFHSLTLFPFFEDTRPPALSFTLETAPTQWQTLPSRQRFYQSLMKSKPSKCTIRSSACAIFVQRDLGTQKNNFIVIAELSIIHRFLSGLTLQMLDKLHSNYTVRKQWSNDQSQRCYPPHSAKDSAVLLWRPWHM